MTQWLNTKLTRRHNGNVATHAHSDVFRSLAEHSPDVIARYDHHLRHMYVNPAIEAATGIKACDFIGKTNDEAGLPTEHCERMDGICRDVLETGEQREVEYTFQDSNGEPRHYITRVVPEFNVAGEVESILTVARDITARKRVDEELTHHRNHLEQLVLERTAELDASHERLRHSERLAALGTLSAGLGHDMGNLLLPLRLRLEAIERKTQEFGDASLEEDIEAMRRCTEYMQRLTNGLRLFAHDPGDESVCERSTDLHQWWNEVEPFLKNALPKHIELQREFPEQGAQLHVRRHLLTQAAFNLVQNAGRAVTERLNKEASPYICVRVTEDCQPGFVRLIVGDNGDGMTAGVKRQCLEPFFTTKPRGLSTGLGLALVYGIIQRVGGRVEIESNQGEGTEVALVIPGQVQPQSYPGLFASLSYGAEETTGTSKGVATVCLADKRMNTFATSILRSLGFEVCPEAGSMLTGVDVLVTDDMHVVSNVTQGSSPHACPNRIVLVSCEAAPCQLDDPRIVWLNPNLGRAAYWRTLRQVASDFTHKFALSSGECRKRQHSMQESV